MPLEPGTRLGPYETVRFLGAGGMGEVYRARDPRLARDVAVKVLAPALAQDRDALARFEREARTASGLNHPHIVHIYDIGEVPMPAGPVHYIAMELVEGETLRARLKAGAPWVSLVEPLWQVADALAKAHKTGIVHRDLKPENVMITSDGYPKVLDFGLAKLMESPAVASVAGSEGQATEWFERRTKSGMIVGTPGYMSPEQVQACPLDARSDVFSFGCILYEAATGRRPFKGDSLVATLHAIVYDEPPPIESINAAVPADLRRIVGRCLAKDPDQRYPSARDLAEDLRRLVRGEAATPPPESQPTTALPRAAATHLVRPRRFVLLGAIVVLLVAAAAAVLRVAPRQGAPERRPAGSPVVEKLTSRGDVGRTAISPDGRYLAYVPDEAGSSISIWLRDLKEKTETRLVGGLQVQWRGLDDVRFARDGQSVYFRYLPKGADEQQLYRVPLIGGEPRVVPGAASGEMSPDETRVASDRRRGDGRVLVVSSLASAHEQELGEVDPDRGPVAWSPDGSKLLLSRVTATSPTRRALFVINSDGTDERKIAEAPAGKKPADAWWSPDGTHVLVSLEREPRAHELVDVDVTTGRTRAVGDKVWGAFSFLRWLPDGTAFVVGEPWSTIWIVSYPDGKAERTPADTHRYGQIGLTSDGTKLVAVQDIQRSEILVSSSPEKGDWRKLVTGTDVKHTLCWTADGKIVFSANDAGTDDLYVMDADGSNRKQLTFDATGDETDPTATPEGRYIVFVSRHDEERTLSRIDRAGGGLRTLTPPGRNNANRDPFLSADGRWVFYRNWNNGPTLWKVPIDGGTPVMVKGAHGGKVEDSALGASTSPDGRSLAFFHWTLTHEGDQEHWSPIVVAISDLEGRIAKTFPYMDVTSPAVRDGQRVQWSADGRDLYYQRLQGNVMNLFRQPVAGGLPVQVTHFEDGLHYFDWSKDGKTLVCSRESGLRDVVLITNFH